MVEQAGLLLDVWLDRRYPHSEKSRFIDTRNGTVHSQKIQIDRHRHAYEKAVLLEMRP